MGTTAQKGAYLNETKSQLKTAINNLGGEITSETTFREYVEELQDVYDNYPKTSYQEGTSITLENCNKGKLDFDEGVVGIGQTSQESTNGYNLLNYITNLKTNFQGLTSQINDDGSITTTGIPAYDYVGIIDINITSMLEIGQSYTISQKTASPYLYLQINATNTQTSQSSYYLLNNETSKTFTAQANTTYLLRLQTSTRANWGTDSRTYTSFYQLEKGSTAHTFEKYTGGYASPSPNWEQEIKYVRGKNLLDKSNASKINGFINYSTNKFETLAQTRSVIFPCEPNTTYTISKVLSARFTTGDTSSEEIENGVSVTNINHTENTTSHTITTGGNAKNIIVFYYLSTTDTLTEQQILDSIQIEERKCSNSIPTI